jgi:hypothetical protein
VVRVCWACFCSGEGLITLEPHYRAAVARVGEDEPADWGEMKPSYQLGRHLINHFMLGHLDIKERRLFSRFLVRATDDLRAHLAWIVGRWIRAPDAEISSLERGMVYAEARLSEAEIAADLASFRKELEGFTIWLDSALLNVQWRIGIVRRIAAIGMLGFGMFAVLRWLAVVSEEYPDAALMVASLALLHPRAKGEAIYGSTVQIRRILASAIGKGSPETARQAVELANALEVRGITGIYDFVNSLAIASGDPSP